MKDSLFIGKAWELKLIQNVCNDIVERGFNKGGRLGILQLSCEYSGLMAQLVAHMVARGNEPVDVEPVNIPYGTEFEVFIHPNQMDKFDKIIVLDSGCLSGQNFTNVEKILLNYGFSRENLFFCCVACSTESIFKPDSCPLYFDGETSMIHFWWETRTSKFDSK